MQLPIRIRSQFDGRGYTDAGVAYPMQVNGLVPFTDTGAWTQTGVAWPLIF